MSRARSKAKVSVEPPAFTNFVAMLFSRFCASLVALAVSTTPSLTLKISTPNANVDGLENLEITTTIINTDDEILKLLNDPRGILDSLPENSFTVTDASGSRPSFTDAKVNCLSFTSLSHVLILSVLF